MAVPMDDWAISPNSYKFALGLGISIFFAFLRYRVPVVPRFLGNMGIVFGLCLIAWSITSLAKLRTESDDLRVSFDFARPDINTIEVRYNFINLGRQSALVRRVDLFELVSSTTQDDIENKLDKCGEVIEKDFRVVTGIASIPAMRGFQIGLGGGSDKGYFYFPKSVIVDERNWFFKDKLAVEGGKTKAATAQFVLEPTHIDGFNLLTLCPSITTIDISGSKSSAVCKGIDYKIVGHGFSSASSIERFRILPHSAEVKCPKAR